MKRGTIQSDNGQYDSIKKQAMLAAIIDSSEDAIISKTLEGIITSWNDAAQRMFGYTESEVIGRHISLLIPEDRLAEEDMIIDRIRQGLRVQHFQTFRRTRKGNLIPISLTISPIRAADGTIIGASKIARDITEEIKTQEEIRQHARTLELVLSVGQAVSEELDLQSILQKVTDLTTRLTDAEYGAFFYNTVDSKGETYLLYTLSGAPNEMFEHFHPPRNTPLFHPTFSGECIVRSGDITRDPRYGKNPPHFGMPGGHLPVVSYLAVPIVSRSGPTIGGLFFGHSRPDMFTPAHEKLVAAIAPIAAVAIDNAKLYEEIKALNIRKDEFIGVAGHELRTPITTIKGYLQLLEAQAKDSMPKDYLGKTLRQVNKLTRLVNDLLDVSKIQAGKLQYEMAACSLLPLIRESVGTVQQIYSTHSIGCILPNEDLVISADSEKIEQVLINLLTNAIKYSPDDPRVTLTVRREGDKALVSVQDHGIGIPAGHLGHLFSRYFRINPNPAIGGLGIGLYICKEIISRHGGLIWAESTEGKGSTFYFSLPLSE
ncbi:MAG TPA: PAS domain S-box protein [Puia sp.]|jgi:PAS domain S-box-containing protein|nr:PAS domain S-box protein [Puia sp.]